MQLHRLRHPPHEARTCTIEVVSDFELSLDPPFFLVAMPQVLDPFFHRTVVIVLEHRGEGSFGYIVNRATDFTVGDLLGGLDMEWNGPAETIGWFGGPVQPQMGTALFISAEADLEGQVMPVRPPTHLTADLNVIRQLAADPPDRFKLILGYSGWSAGQLDEEMNRNDWLVAPFDEDILFTVDPDTTWTRALALIDVKPESLAAWSPSEPGSSN